MCEVKDRGAVRGFWILALFIGAFTLVSCRKSAPTTPSTAITCTTTTSTTSTTTSSSSCTDPTTGISIAISPTTVSVTVATSTQFQKGISGGTNNIVTWQVNNITGGKDTVGRIDSNGLSHAPAAVPSPANLNVSAVQFVKPTIIAITT